MRFTIIEAWFCVSIGTICTFVFGISGLLASFLYIAIRGICSNSVFTKRASYVLIAVSALLLNEYSGLNVAPNAWRQMSSSNDIAFARKALQDYVAHHGVLPWVGDTQTRMSWRVKLLPYVGMQDLHDRLDLAQPWNSDANRDMLITVKDPFPQTAFGSGVFRIRGASPPTAGVTSVVLVEMAATPTHWAALEKDPILDEFLNREVLSIHATQSWYSTFTRGPSGTHALLSNWEIIHIRSKLPVTQWRMLVDPPPRPSTDLESLLQGEHLFGDQFSEREWRYDKVVGAAVLAVFVLMHVAWFIRLRVNTQHGTNDRDLAKQRRRTIG